MSGCTAAEPAGLLWAWWDGDPWSELAPLPGQTVEAVRDVASVAEIMRTASEQVQTATGGGRRLYVAHIGAIPVAYGWSVTGETVFGDPPRQIGVPAGNRYLRDFVTLPAWRGRGIYPRLLQEIVRQEVQATKCFWILHQFANIASARGIRKAGFSLVAEVWDVGEGHLAMQTVGSGERAPAGAAVLNLPLLTFS